MKKEKIIHDDDYQYGFRDQDKSVYNTGKGLNKDIIRKISAKKNEPQWMLDFRLRSYDYFVDAKLPKWGPDLTFINFDDYTYYIKPSETQEENWENVEDTYKETFDKLGILEAEKYHLGGVSTQYESEVIYHNMLKEVEEKGVIFLDTDSALREHPDLFKKYFNTVVPYQDNKFAALNGAVWSGGSFIYIPKGVKLEKPLQSYFRINSDQMGQFERTLIIVDEGAEVDYVEGCTAPIYSNNSLHTAVVEIIVHDNAKCRYSTVQNWSKNILNLVTKRAYVHAGGSMEWIDGNIGSGLTMKYPSCVLAGDNAKGAIVSISVASHKMILDAGAKMIHLGKNTSSNIISKSIASLGGEVNYRGSVYHGKQALNAKSHIECDTLLIDDTSKSDTIPSNTIKNNQSSIEHEATVSKVSEDQLFYLMSRGLTEEAATEMIIMGFIEPFTKELPMEYAVELNQLIKMEMDDAIG